MHLCLTGFLTDDSVGTSLKYPERHRLCLPGEDITADDCILVFPAGEQTKDADKNEKWSHEIYR